MDPDYDEVRALAAFYNNQAGGYYSYYSNPVLNQKGHGVGSFLGGLFRSVIPLFKTRTSKMIGRRLLSGASDMLNDIRDDPSQFSRSLKRNSFNALKNIRDDLITQRGGHLITHIPPNKGRKRKSGAGGVSDGKITKRKKIKTDTRSRRNTVRKAPSKTTSRRRRKSIDSSEDDDSLDFLD
jgi:hypothetical protein